METPSRGGYNILRRLDVGGMAEVFLAERSGSGGFRKRVVIKQLLPRYARDPKVVAMFLDEARLAARLSHPNIVQVFDVGESEGTYFIAMEYLDGEPLDQIIANSALSGAHLPAGVVAHIGSVVADALAHAHGLTDENGRALHVIHRDVKPSNIFVMRSGHVKLIDFGIARARSHVSTTEAGVLKGTIRYMAPEQLAFGLIDQRLDIYALGLVLYECAMGELPPNYDPSQQRIGLSLAAAHVVPDALATIVDRALQIDPKDRFASAAQMRDELQSWLVAQSRPVAREEIVALLSGAAGAEDAPHAATRLSARRPRPAGRAANPATPARPAGEDDSTDMLVGHLKRRRSLRVIVGVAIVGTAVATGVVSLSLGEDAMVPRDPPEKSGELPQSSRSLDAADEPAEHARAHAPPSSTKSAKKDRRIEKRSARPTPANKARASALVEDGNRSLLRGHFAAAAKTFAEALGHAPNHPEAHRGLGFAAAELGQTTRARRHLRRYLTLASGAKDADVVRARLEKLE